MGTQLGLHTFQLSYVEVEPGVMLPDLADLIMQRLEHGKPLRFDHDLTSIAKQALRQVEEKRDAKPKLRMSRSGGCVKHLSYIAHGVEPVKRHNWDPSHIDAGSKLTFTIGDVTESVLNAVLQEVIAESSLLELEDTGQGQVEVSITVGDVTIDGHPDGFLAVPLMRDGVGHDRDVRCVWEVKSMADYGYRLFRSVGLTEEDSYYWQTQAYMGAENLVAENEGRRPVEWAYIIGYGKTTTARDTETHDDGTWNKRPPIHGQWIRYDPAALQYVVSKFAHAIEVEPDDIARPYAPKTGKKTKGQLGFPCGWCSHAFNCFPNATVRATEGGFYMRTNKVVIHANEQE